MKLIWAVLLMSGIAWGQKPPPMTGDDCYHAKDGTFHCYQGDIDTPKVIAQGIPISSPSQGEIDAMNKKPLKCGKYQHPEATDCNICDQKTHMCTLMNCINIPDHCADDIHTVTEKEWKELQAEVKLLHKAIHLMESGGRP